MKEPLAVKKGEGESMMCLGAGIRFLLQADRTEHSFSLMEVELAKDQGPPPHEHPWDEAYYILDGDVWFLVDSQETVYSAGDFVYAPGGTIHSFRGAGDRPAKVLVFDAPAAAEGFFREASSEVVNIPEDFVKVPEIAARHGLRFLPPTA